MTMDWEYHILKEIANNKMKRLDIAQTYRILLEEKYRAGKEPDWNRINAAIIERWSVSALIYIKEQAWSGKCWKGVPEVV